ncbi:hypothetical protein EBZ37_03850 [bacterium]|nr:hypothetical protein [bacterium]
MTFTGWKFLFPHGTMSSFNGSRSDLNELFIKNGEIVHSRIPQFHLLEQYVRAFHEGHARSPQFGVFYGSERLTDDSVREQTRFIPFARLPSGMKDLPLKNIISFWSQFQESPMETLLSEQAFNKQLLSRWMEYRWSDIPARVQIIAMACFISRSHQFLTLVLPDHRMPDSDPGSLYQGLKNLAEQKSLSVIVMSRMREFEKLSSNISFNGFPELDHSHFSPEQDDELQELD